MIDDDCYHYTFLFDDGCFSYTFCLMMISTLHFLLHDFYIALFYFMIATATLCA